MVGNGNGVGIAARYYFNKDVRDLSLVEAAFIAGSVKGPSKYNPFIKSTKERKIRAKNYANLRKNYVLRRMYEQKWISKDEYEDSVILDVPFKRGKFRNSEISLINLVRMQLGKKEVLKAIGLKSVDELNTAGLKVYTTLDLEFQKSAQLAMRRNLSRIETILGGFAPELGKKYKDLKSLKVKDFYYGKVKEIRGSAVADWEVLVSFGMIEGIIPNRSLRRYARLLNLSDGIGFEKHFQKIMQNLKLGDILFTQAIKYNPDNHQAVLELHKYPKVNGGMIALDKGEVRAVVSGFETSGYNRALFAKRPPGSVFKSLFFFAGLQLGWSILDRINNMRQVFSFQGTNYYPRPDHRTPYKDVSMLWAGVMSENLAAVALGSRLLDKLSFDQFKKLLEFMGLAPYSGESIRDYSYRLSKQTGITLDRSGIKSYQLQNVVDALTPDLVFSGDSETLDTLKQLWWGRSYDLELASLHLNSEDVLSTREIKIRMSLVENSMLRYQRLTDDLLVDWDNIQEAVSQYGPQVVYQNLDIAKKLTSFRMSKNSQGKWDVHYYKRYEDEKPLFLNTEDLAKKVPFPKIKGKKLTLLDVQSIWGNNVKNVLAYNSIQSVRLNGKMPVRLYRKLTQLVSEKYKQVLSVKDPYRLYRAYQHHDFRTAIALKYAMKLAQECGIYNRLQPVLSLPLGTSDVSVSEMAKLYQTFVEGKVYRFFQDGPKNQITFIRRVEDRHGNILFEAKPHVHQLVTENVSHEMKEILRKTVTNGTGRRARGAKHKSKSRRSHDSGK